VIGGGAVAAALAYLLIAAEPAAAASPCRLRAPTGVAIEHEGPTDFTRYLRPSGKLRAVVLFVDFPNAAPTATEREGRVDLLRPAAPWFTTSSYGRVSVQLTFDTAWRRMPNPHGAYTGYNTSFTAQQEYVQDAVTAADAAVDFSQYQLVYVVPPRSATTMTNSPAFIANPGWGAFADGTELRHGATFGQDLDFWGYKVLNHETGHVFGLPDLYSYQPAPNIHAAVGGWDLMGFISGAAPDHLAWHKWKMGWLDDAQIACRTTSGETLSTLAPLNQAGGLKASIVRIAPRQAVVVENRQVSPLDVKFRCFTPGVLVYLVDGSVGGGSYPVTVADHQPNSAVANCNPAQGELANATLTAVGDQIVVSGVRVRLTAVNGTSPTVRVIWQDG